MKNKKMVLLIAIAVIVIAAAAFAAVHAVKVDEVKTTEVITVTDAEMTAEQAAIGEEETFEIVEIVGNITEIAEDYVLIDAGEMGMIQANTSIDTLIEGVEELAVGQTAVILYDGKMTRSLPAQITALRINMGIMASASRQVVSISSCRTPLLRMVVSAIRGIRISSVALDSGVIRKI